MTSNIHPPFLVNSTMTFSRSLFTICDTSTAFSSAASVLLLHSILRTTFEISVLRCALRVNFETKFRIWLWLSGYGLGLGLRLGSGLGPGSGLELVFGLGLGLGVGLGLG